MTTQIKTAAENINDTTTPIDALFATAWAAAGGNEPERRRNTGSQEALDSSIRIQPGEIIPVRDGLAAVSACRVICGGGQLCIGYLPTDDMGRVLSRALPGGYHPDTGSVNPSRAKRLTRRPYQQPATA